jgi:hypothetical protein
MPTRKAENRRLKALTAELESAITSEFLLMVAGMRRHLRNAGGGDPTFFIMSEVAKFTNILARAFATVGRSEAAAISRKLGKPIRFDPTHPYVGKLIGEARQRFLRDFAKDQHAVIRQAVSRMTKAYNPNEPRDPKTPIASTIGLTAQDENYAANYYYSLSRNNADALDRVLRDKRFDSTVEEAVEGNEQLSTADIDRMVEAYRRRRLVYRAKRIAHVVALNAINESRHAALRQAANQANFREDQIIRIWNAVGDDATRDSHFSLDGAEVQGFDEPFDSDHGPIMYPGDPAADIAETAGCRCWITFRLPGEGEE